MTLHELESQCRAWGKALGMEVETYQSNSEGSIIDELQSALGRFDGIVLNGGAYSHTSYAIHDAIEAIGIPVVEVHISDIANREPWRAVSVTAPACMTSIIGHGTDGYRQALELLAAI